MQHLKAPILAKLAVLATALALQGAAMAATTDAPASVAPASTTQNATSAGATQASPAAPHAKRRHHEKMDASLWVPGFGPVGHKLVRTLNLNDSQKKVLADAQAEQNAFQKSVHDLKQTAREEQKTQLDTGKIDPHAAQKAADAMWKNDLSGNRRDQLSQKWLAVWDALDSTQQQKITVYLKKRADRHAGHDKHERRHH